METNAFVIAFFGDVKICNENWMKTLLLVDILFSSISATFIVEMLHTNNIKFSPSKIFNNR